jgi:hypothetical protein
MKRHLIKRRSNCWGVLIKVMAAEVTLKLQGDEQRIFRPFTKIEPFQKGKHCTVDLLIKICKKIIFSTKTDNLN